jgi:hypothetical protein
MHPRAAGDAQRYFKTYRASGNKVFPAQAQPLGSRQRRRHHNRSIEYQRMMGIVKVKSMNYMPLSKGALATGTYP